MIYVILFFIYFLFDMNYFIRGIWTFIRSYINFIRKPISPFETSVHYDTCFFTDLDLWFHMNNARYLREADFGRIKFLVESGIGKALYSLGGSFTNGGNNIRYRKSINLFDRYRIETKVLYWDDKAFYLEQQFIRDSDKFVCAVNVMRLSIMNSSTSQVLEKLGCRDAIRPEPLPELVKWMEAAQLSSDRLKKAS
ncbi:hypothetical protein CHS0354_037151 [Potamilus streckersoni]|uniref:Protein THEM6 n=1 Tax=Potamilus streckersoni TaxID=2493646 RepID=A0AAE0RPA6_9BIVA|nr:hypothetical protein CHS0354_037151 [Potamilus streckersoni]